VPGSIETGRWYDLRIELRGTTVKAYIDGQLIHEAQNKPISVFFASAGLDHRANELVLQLVNPRDEARDVAIHLNGTCKPGSTASVITLTGAEPDAENTLSHPDAIAPKTSEFTGVAPEFTYTVGPHSLTTLRIPEQ